MTAELLQSLLRIDSRNPGSTEMAAAMFVRDRLRGKCEVIEASPGRASVVSRVRGRSSDRALLVHAHLDTVGPGDGWTVEPFGGEIRDGFVWGRGALDMKHAVAMMLTAQESLLDEAPEHDVVFAYLADEETGGALGAKHLVAEHPNILEGVTHAIGEVGGFIVDGNAYLQCGEKGVIWARLSCSGPGGHGAFSDPAQAPVARVARAVAALTASEVVGGAWHERVASLGASTTFVATQLDARSGAPNVVTGHAAVDLDVRTAPGDHDSARERLFQTGLDVELLRDEPGYSSPLKGPVLDAIHLAIDSDVVPFVLPAATDGRHFSSLGIDCYGFVPLPVEPSFDPFALMHAADERVPLRALAEGSRILSEVVRRW